MGPACAEKPPAESTAHVVTAGMLCVAAGESPAEATAQVAAAGPACSESAGVEMAGIANWGCVQTGVAVSGEQSWG